MRPRDMKQETNQFIHLRPCGGTEIRVEGGIGRVWEARPGHWSWAHPDGSEGCDEKSFDAAVEAVEAVKSGEVE
jgi:hypothetical protein